jgi:hypothetical protein
MHLKFCSLIILAAVLAGCGGGQKIAVKRDAAPGPPSAQKKELFLIDFRYSPPWWQTAICLPDDWQKTLVSKEGALLYEYPGEFSGFGTKVAIALEGAAAGKTSQTMDNPRVPVVETALADSSGSELIRWSTLAVVPGEGQNLPVHKKSAGAKYEKPPRGDLLLIKKTSKYASISLTVQSKEPLELADLTVFRGRRRFLGMSARWNSLGRVQNGLKVIFSPAVEELAIYCASGHEAGDVDLQWAKTQPERAARYWHSLDLPYQHISLPDAAMQALLDSCIRNIYQAREVKDGLPVFQVGPTCYRGLWVVDGAFILEAMTVLGRGEEARSGIRHLLTRQKPDGSFEILPNYWKENGIVLYIITRHALLTQDLGWLRQNWERVKRVVRIIQDLRKRSRQNPSAPEAGLMPPGFPDGGIGGVVPEYTNIYWNLSGLKAAVEAARLIQAPELAEWKAEFDDFWKAFRSAAKRDAKKTDDGQTYLPILMTPVEGIDPVRGQWGFCHGVYPGKLFGPDDPLALGTLALLDRHEAEGLVKGTGWMPDGIWNYFGSFYGHAHLWLGHGEKASEIYYAFANHASPLRAWREEQPPRGEKTQAPFVGDMPHNWASAEFIRMTRNLLVLERGDELHLLEGIPRSWLAPGAVTELRDIATDFGPMTFKLEVAADGAKAHLSYTPPTNDRLRKTIVHLGSWAAEGKITIEEKGGTYDLVIPLVKWRRYLTAEHKKTDNRKPLERHWANRLKRIS